MNVVFTCGGTGGHINPAIAVANIWKERHPGDNILFIGAKDRMEEKLVPQAGYRLHTIPASGLSRGKSFKALKTNIKAVGYIFEALRSCKKVLREFQADVVVGTGGYASFPALLAASQMGIPTCVHEANAMPGLTTRMIAGRATRVLTCFPESAKYYRHPEKVETVGMPVRREFIFTQRDAARKELGVDERPLIVSAFGSQGAKAMNEVTAQLFRLEKEAGYPFQHIHATGRYGVEWMPDYVKQQGVELADHPCIDMREYIYNMPTVMAASDLMICRAGAATISELTVSGTPAIIVPSPNVTDNHQEKNARVLEECGAAVVLRESECTGEVLYRTAADLLADPARLRSMREALAKLAVVDSTQRIVSTVLELMQSH